MRLKQKFEPADGRVLHGAGQSSEQFKKYWDAVGENKPLIYMAYNRINDITEKFHKKLEGLYSINKELWLQLGLNLKPKEENEDCKGIISGKYDKEIFSLIKTIKDFKNPVFLRIGYEFNNPDHNYNSKEFILAWRYIVDLFRKYSVKNVAFVWDACTAFNKDLKEIMNFYPGDEYVDWFGNNFFGVQHFKDNQDNVTEDFYKESIKHKKPLMIAESSAIKTGTLNGEESWKAWFKPYFNWIKTHPNTKAFCYINWDWAVDWKQLEWGNCRIEENEFIRRAYIKEMSDKRYVHLN